MKKIYLLCIASLLMVCAGSAVAQDVTTAGAAASAATNKRIQQLDILIKIVPLALQKSQYDTLIDAIDKARAIEKAEQEAEDKLLADLDPKVAEAVDNAVNKGIYPPRELQDSIQKEISKMVNKQMNIAFQMIKTVYAAIKDGLNAGQRKVMVGSFTNQYVDSNMKPEDMTDEIKINFFIKRVFLDEAAYELLKDMQKHAS